MRRAMAEAEVGDDAYGEDPTVRRLEERVSELLGKEAALFVPSGTMSNQIALLVHTQPGDEVIVGEGTHCAWNEAGAGAALAGVQFQVVGHGGLFDADDLLRAIKPPGDQYPRTSLVALENTHNRAGGRVFPQARLQAIADAARAHQLKLHLDGARIWNAALASNLSLAELARPFDTLNVCFSKGLGAPVGSALVGSREHVTRARRFRKRLGGAMRQAGVLAAAALYGLEHQRARLAEDHATAKLLAELLRDAPGLQLPEQPIETNIVQIGATRLEARQLVRLAAEQGVLLNASGPSTLRAVTHLDVSREQVESAARVLRSLAAA
jgi:threonine aldolase